MKVGYIRTSKKDQNPELQRRDLLAFGCEKIFEEQISSRKETNSTPASSARSQDR